LKIKICSYFFLSKLDARKKWQIQKTNKKEGKTKSSAQTLENFFDKKNFYIFSIFHINFGEIYEISKVELNSEGVGLGPPIH
jgi:hypothetical protein